MRPPWGSKFFQFHGVFGKKLRLQAVTTMRPCLHLPSMSLFYKWYLWSFNIVCKHYHRAALNPFLYGTKPVMLAVCVNGRKSLVPNIETYPESRVGWPSSMVPVSPTSTTEIYICDLFWKTVFDLTDWFGEIHFTSSQLWNLVIYIKKNKFNLIFDQNEVKRRLVEKKEKGPLSPLMVIHSGLNRRN